MPSVDTKAPAIRTGASAQATQTAQTAPATQTPQAQTVRDAPAGARRRVKLALFALGLATFGMLYSTQALLPEIAADFHVSPDAASWTVSAATIGLAVAVLPLSALSERFGRCTMMTWSVALAVAIGLLLPLAPNLDTLIALRAVQGAAIAGVPVSAMAYLSEEVRASSVVSAVGLFVAGNSIGGMTSRVAGGWVAEGWGWRAALAVLAATAVLCAIAYRLLIPTERNFTPTPLNPRHLLRAVSGHLANPLLLRLYGIGMLVMSVFGAVYTVIGFRLVAEPFNLSPGLVGSIFAIYLVGTVCSATTGALTSRLGRRGALYLAMSFSGVGLLLTLTTELLVVLLGLVLITAGFFFGHTAASGSVSAAATTGRAQAAALYQMAFYLGSSLGGALGALAFHAAGWNATVALAMTALLGAAGITLYATRLAVVARRHPEPAAVPAG